MHVIVAAHFLWFRCRLRTLFNFLRWCGCSGSGRALYGIRNLVFMNVLAVQLYFRKVMFLSAVWSILPKSSRFITERGKFTTGIMYDTLIDIQGSSSRFLARYSILARYSTRERDRPGQSPEQTLSIIQNGTLRPAFSACAVLATQLASAAAYFPPNYC